MYDDIPVEEAPLDEYATESEHAPSSVEFDEEYDNKYDRIFSRKRHVLMDRVASPLTTQGNPKFALTTTQIERLFRALDKLDQFDFSARDEIDSSVPRPPRPFEFREDYFERVKESIIKWRTMEIKRVRKLGNHVVFDVKSTRITSSELIPKTKTRASWFVEYGSRKDTGDIRLCEVLFFITVDIPIIDFKEITNDNGETVEVYGYEYVDSPETEERPIRTRRLLFAYIETIPMTFEYIALHRDLTLTDDRIDTYPLDDHIYLMKKNKKKKQDKRFVHAELIRCLVGFVFCRDEEYAVWKDCCYKRRSEHTKV